MRAGGTMKTGLVASGKWQACPASRGVAAGVLLALGMLLAGTAQAQVQASGGSITRYRENGTNWIAHIFTNSAAAETLTFSSDTDVEYLIVAGGGGGGGAWQGGGGGAGGFLTGTTNLLFANYTVTVGAPGIGGYNSGNTLNGGDSSLTNSALAIIAYGGGAGGGESYAGKSGGSGGGGANNTAAGGGSAGPPIQGYSGGTAAHQSGAGGGGAGGVGSNSVSNAVGGGGGPGRSSTMRNGVTAVTYATGGAGSNGRTAPSGPHRDPNTGDGGYGGGASSSTGKGNNGGSGIVIVRYVDSGTFTASVAVASATAQWPVQSGAFTITRPDDANTSYVAVVSYTMSGDAVNGTDYSANSVINGTTGFPTPTPTPLSGTATFGVGVTSVVVNLYPLYNPPFSAKTATMTLNVVGSPTADVDFQAWSASGWANVTSGGVVTNYSVGITNYIAHIFTNSAAAETLTVTRGGEVEYLVVAGGGGGGGGWNGGGGGAGGVRLGSVTLPAGSYTVTVGAGGPGLNRLGNPAEGSNGLPSVISAAVGIIGATGGGRGSSERFYDARDGVGSGGSGGGTSGTAVGGGELGNNGGTGSQDWTGGGGGARTVGGTGANPTQGAGGAGTNFTFSGVSVEYAKGGTGCAGRNGVDGANASANMGNGGSGGGGGLAVKGGNGGSGIVIVRHIVPSAAVIAPTNNQSFIEGVDSISATAAVYNASAASTVRFYTNTASGPSFGLAGTDITDPYTVDLGSSLAATNYQIYVTASNATDGVFYSATNTFVVVLQALGVTVTEPGPGDGYGPGASITATATVQFATEPISVQFFTNGVSAGTDSAGPDYTLSLGTLTPATYEIHAVVTDAGGSATSATNTFTVYATAVLGGDLVRYRENGTNWIARIFTNSAAAGTLNVLAATDVEYLLVAGGGAGGGGWNGAGGGAGGVKRGSANLPAATYTITVGAGGIGNTDVGAAASNSIIVGTAINLFATGGGSGGTDGGAGTQGGSGGGGVKNGAGAIQSATAASNAELGNKGGNSADTGMGGGGGARTAGVNGSGNTPGAGGGGTNLTFSGPPVTYATGGNGGWRNTTTPFNGTGGTANTGNGGSGGGGNATRTGGNGGSGIVIVRHEDPGSFSASVTATAATAQWPVQIGAFTITRPDDANTSYVAVVSYTMSGSAVNGTDYSANSVANGAIGNPTPAAQSLSGYATFGVGVTSVVVNVYPLYNPPFSAKTATMTLNVPGSPAADVDFQAWSSGTAAATGGTVANYTENGTNYVAHVFTSGDTLTLTSGGEVEYLIVGGGGGGGGSHQGGGGGAGGFLAGTVALPAGTYTVTVGNGGNGRFQGSGISSGGNSSIGASAIVAYGGGYGGGEGLNAANGASGGGGAWSGAKGTGWAGPPVQGYAGGNAGSQSGSGGGGAAGVGANTDGTTGGAGGPGRSSTMGDGVTPVTYATGGTGSNGRVSPDPGATAAANTGDAGGGGGGGAGAVGGNGGSGIVIVRYVAVEPGTLFLLR